MGSEVNEEGNGAPKAKPRGLLPRRAADALGKDRNLRALLVGETGGGKTWRAAKSPRPFVVLTEPNGEDSLVKANHDAVYAIVSTMSEVRHWIAKAQSGELAAEFGVRTLVIDGLTEVQRLMKDEMTGGAAGNTEMSQNDWGILADKMRGLCRVLRALPLHVVCTVLASTEKDGEKSLRVVPQLQGRAIQPELGQYFNLVAYCFRADGDEMSEPDRFLAMCSGPARYFCKGCDPVAGIRRDSPAEWFNLILNSHGTASDAAVVADARAPELKTPIASTPKSVPVPARK